MGRVLGGQSRWCLQAAQGTAAAPGCWPPRFSGEKAAAPIEAEAGMLEVMKFTKTNTGGEL